ncbi:hypothetical protein TKK_0009222 [Trichogramma kaykai]
MMEEESDYSASASAIILQRRNSSRRYSRRGHKRRASSPFSPEVENVLRRRSSVFTTSSGDTAISMDDCGVGSRTAAATNTALVEEQRIFENLKLHKEVLNGVKQQPWPLGRKLKLVRQAKVYVRKHEGALQERLAQSRSTRDAIARASIIIAKNWQHLKREVINAKTVLVPWERRIKQIESQFGSAVASYFIFLRWLFGINLVISAALVTFVAIPELLATLQNATIAGERKTMLPEEQARSTHLLTLWEFEGELKYSPFFYGWYANQHSYKAYKLPLAYFLVNLVVYTYSFFAILRKMAENSRMSKLSEKEDECAFSWKLFTGWDFMIGNAETAHNRIGSIVLGLKEALLEESEKQRDERNWKIISIRIVVNLLVIGLLAASAYAVVEVVERSEHIPEEERGNWWRQNEITVVMTLITYSFPIIFELLGIVESYHPRKQLRLQLGRIMILNLLNMYSLIYALFKKINSSDEKLQSLKPSDFLTNVSCVDQLVPCSGTPSNVVYAASTFASTFATGMSLVLNRPNVSRPSAAAATSSSEELELKTELPLYPASDDFPFAESKSNGNNNNSSYRHDVVTATGVLGLPGNDTNPYEAASLRLRNSLTQDTLDADNALSSDDAYPHVDYDYYGSYEQSDKTNSSNKSDLPVGTKSPFRDNESVSDGTTAPATTTIPNIELNVTVHDTCREISRIVQCYVRICENQTLTFDNFSAYTTALDLKTRRKLRGLCWETMFGQELAKLTMMDLVLTVLTTMIIDFFRALFVRYMNNCWCWDLEKQFPQYGDFKIAENILHLVNNQGMVWMGIFFSPGLIVLNVAKLIILMYLRSWTVLTCNVPHEIVFRASRSNNFYLALLLTMLFLCVLPVGYAIVWVEPSWHCGPFSGYKRIYHLATTSLRNALPNYVLEYRILDYIASPGIVIPLIVLMTLIIYYMISLTNALRESNNDLKIQLRQERTEERRKMFKIAEKRHNESETPFTKWKKILPNLGPRKSIDLASTKAKFGIPNVELEQTKLQIDTHTLDVESLLANEHLSNLDQSETVNENISKSLSELTESVIPTIHISPEEVDQNN